VTFSPVGPTLLHGDGPHFSANGDGDTTNHPEPGSNAAQVLARLCSLLRSSFSPIFVRNLFSEQ